MLDTVVTSRSNVNAKVRVDVVLTVAIVAPKRIWVAASLDKTAVVDNHRVVAVEVEQNREALDC